MDTGSVGDSSALASDFSSAMPNLSTDLASMLGTSLETDLATTFPQLSMGLSSSPCHLFGDAFLELKRQHTPGWQDR